MGIILRLFSFSCLDPAMPIRRVTVNTVRPCAMNGRSSINYIYISPQQYIDA